MAIEREITLNDYISIIKRRFPHVVGFFLMIFLAAIAVAIKLPSVYESTATILIESQQVISDSAAKENFASDRFEVLKQVALSKDNLYQIAKKYSLFGLDKKPNLPMEGVVKAMRGNTQINLLKAEGEQWAEKPTFALQVGFKYHKADETYNITNDLVKLFMDENDRASKARVNENADFYTKEAAKQKVVLESIEKEVTRYKQNHSHSLPENRVMQIGSLDRLENDLRATQREYSATQAELRSLDVSLASAKAGIGLTAPQEQAPNNTAVELENLKSELAKQSSIYSENHPSIRALQRKINALEKSEGSPKTTNSVTPQSIMIAKVQAQIDTANDRLKALTSEEMSIRAKISQSESRVIASAQTEGELGRLLRDYDNAKVAYAEIKAKLDNSKLAKNIEMENKGERFVLSEAPILPEKPVKPNRIMIIIAGFFAAIAGAIGAVVLMDMLDKRVRGVNALATLMQIQPMATIPYITNKAELKQKKYLISKIIFSTLAVILIVLLIVHVFIMPLDIVMSKISAKF